MEDVASIGVLAFACIGCEHARYIVYLCTSDRECLLFAYACDGLVCLCMPADARVCVQGVQMCVSVRTRLHANVRGLCMFGSRICTRVRGI